jgi:hypothetical protein
MLEIKVTIDLSKNAEQILTDLLTLIQGQKYETPKAETPKAETPKAETPKAETPKAETPKVEKPVAPKAEAPKTGSSVAPKAEMPKAESPKLTVEAIRELMHAKVNNYDNRTKLKNKLSELGAGNVTTLDPKYYQEFYDYMITLP